jgi:proteasome beta subunit
MSTVLGVTCAGGVVLAGDRVVATGGQVRSRSRRHVFDLGRAGVAVVGADVDRFADRLDGEVRAYRTERGSLGIDPFARLASDLAAAFDVSAVLAAPDDGGVGLRAVTPDGGVTTDEMSAFGSGASVALGVLEAGHDPDATLDAVTTLVRDALSTAAERDAGTGTEIDSYRLPARDDP